MFGKTDILIIDILGSAGWWEEAPAAAGVEAVGLVELGECAGGESAGGGDEGGVRQGPGGEAGHLQPTHRPNQGSIIDPWSPIFLKAYDVAKFFPRKILILSSLKSILFCI